MGSLQALTCQGPASPCCRQTPPILRPPWSMQMTPAETRRLPQVHPAQDSLEKWLPEVSHRYLAATSRDLLPSQPPRAPLKQPHVPGPSQPHCPGLNPTEKHPPYGGHPSPPVWPRFWPRFGCLPQGSNPAHVAARGVLPGDAGWSPDMSFSQPARVDLVAWEGPRLTSRLASGSVW